MNKLPTKQIYLLMIIVFGIVTLSVYSTYSIFTLDAESEDIVSIHTPSNLNVLSDTYEYRQVRLLANTYKTIDLDIYNNTNNELCYGVWYKVINNNIDKDKVKVYQNTDNSLTTNGVISGISNKRINIFITNDNEEEVKVNIGLIYNEKNDTCNLNIPSDKLQVVSTINNPRSLSDTLINNTSDTDILEGYLTYSYKDNEITFDNDELIYISNQFKLKDEEFQLVKMEEVIDNERVEVDKQVKFEELVNYQNYYTCFDSNKCDLLYRIKNVVKEENKYKITDYDILVPYMAGEVGLRKVNNNYYYYGDNPNNYVYFNCSLLGDNKTCELWRIIGFVKENDKYYTKLIRSDSTSKYKYNEQVWKDSDISKYLNKEYKLNNAYEYIRLFKCFNM